MTRRYSDNGRRGRTTGIRALCCSGGDCGPIEESRITKAPGEYIIDGRWHVPVRSATPSPDGRFHGCWPDKDKPPVCVFAPPDGV